MELRKTFIFLVGVVLGAVVLFSCSDDEDEKVTPQPEKETVYSPFGIWKCDLQDGSYCMLYSVMKNDSDYVGVVTYGGNLIPGEMAFRKTEFTFASDSTGAGLVMKGVFADGKQNQFTGNLIYGGQPLLTNVVFYRQSDFNKPTVTAKFEVVDTAGQITPYLPTLQAVVEKYDESKELSGTLSTRLTSAVTFFATKKATCDTLAKKQVEQVPALSMTAACVQVKMAFIYDLFPQSFTYKSYYSNVGK